MRKIYQKIASEIERRNRCWKDAEKHSIISGNETECSLYQSARNDAQANLDKIMQDAPSGSGIDCGTKLDSASSPEKLIFFIEFHHMNEVGYYDGWTQHKLIITPSLVFYYDMKITGPNRNGIKEYLYDIYGEWLDMDFELLN